MTLCARVAAALARLVVVAGLLASASVVQADVQWMTLAGLRVVEVEFPDDDAANAFTPPDWFGRELTGDARWSNAELARHGVPT